MYLKGIYKKTIYNRDNYYVGLIKVSDNDIDPGLNDHAIIFTGYFNEINIDVLSSKGFTDEKGNDLRNLKFNFGKPEDEDSEYILIQWDKTVGHISVKNPKNGDKAFISVDDILYIESYGHQIEITTKDGMYIGRDPLYQLEGMLNKRRFTRVNKSSIIANKHVKRINPSLSMKFTLLMSDGRKIEVTRNYYNSFKETFHI